jgi:hypothetical protein
MEMKEVYDNPNYSHILIGGQPFFILPSGELSGHVPVPSQGERLTPRPRPPRQVFEGGGGSGGPLPSYNLGKTFFTIQTFNEYLIDKKGGGGVAFSTAVPRASSRAGQP